MRIAELIGDHDKVVVLIEKYEKELELSEDEIAIKGKTLEEANAEQGLLMHRYARLYAECRNVVKYLDVRADQIRAEQFKKIKNTSDRNLADRTIDKYVEGEQLLVDHVALVIEMRNLEDKLGAVVEAIKMRGYALNNVTRARIESVHMAVL